MRIGWDLDGVGYVFGAGVRRSLALDGIEVEEPTDEFCKHWNFFEFWGMTREEFADACDVAVDRGICFGPGEGLTRPNFFDAMARVKEMGHTNVIITHRFQGKPGLAMRNTFRWLEVESSRYGIDLYDEIHFTHDKTIVPTDMFVEDNRDNYDNLVAAGVDAYLINRPWNGPYDDHRTRIEDVEDYATAVAARTLAYSVV